MSSPGSARSAPALKGYTEPRIYTPPLTELTADTSWGFECIDFIENVLGWELLPWQRWLYIHALEKSEDRQGFRYQTLVILIARQNGKTQWLKGLGLWRLYVDGAQQVLISAQNLEFAETTLSEVVADVKANPLLRKEFLRFSQTNGKYKMRLDGGREWRAAVASRKGGRSLSVDLALLDELREHQNWLAWNAIVPTTTARPRSLVVAASNAGDSTSVVLRSLRDGSIARILNRDTDDTRTGLFEWSAPDDADPMDPTYWPMANPAQGYLFESDSLRGRAEAMYDNVPGFRTEHLCQWVDALEPGVIPAEHWTATTDPHSKRADGSPVWASVDVNFARSKAYIAVASRRADDNLHIEVVAAERGTDWIVPWLAERADKFQNVVIQARGAPASGLIDDILEAGVPVLELGGTDLTRAYGHFYDLIVGHKIRHRPSPVLDAAAESAKSRTIGDAWVIDRKGSPVDCSPLVACIQAVAGEMLWQPVQRSAYESKDLLVV